MLHAYWKANNTIVVGTYRDETIAEFLHWNYMLRYSGEIKKRSLTRVYMIITGCHRPFWYLMEDARSCDGQFPVLTCGCASCAWAHPFLDEILQRIWPLLMTFLGLIHLVYLVRLYTQHASCFIYFPKMGLDGSNSCDSRKERQAASIWNLDWRSNSERTLWTSIHSKDLRKINRPDKI